MSGALQPLRNAYLETNLGMGDKQLTGDWGQSTPFALGFLASEDESAMRSYIGAGLGTGTVTSVAVSGANGIGVANSPITGSGTIGLSLGAITPTSVNGLIFVGAATGFTIAGGTTSKTLTVSNTLTLAGTDGSTLNVGAGGTLGTAAFTAATAYQAADAELLAIAGLISAADRLPYFTGTGTAALATFTAAGRALVDDADATAQRTTLGLAIGTNVQAFSSVLTTYAGIAPSANVQTLLGAANFAAFRTSLGVAIGSDVQAWDADLDAIAALAGTSGLLKKTGANTWTLDTSTYATQAYADALVVGLLDDRGNYNASVNTFPASGGSGSAGAVLKGDLWTISVAGTLGSTAVTAGDVVRALVDTPGQTAGNWAIGENNFGYVALNQALADGKIYVGNGSGIGTAVTPTGDVTMTNAGVTAIGATKVTSAMLNSDVYSTAHSWGGTQTFTAPVLGTPGSGTLTNCIGLPVASGISGLGTGVATALAVNVGSAGAFVTFNGALGTPSSGTVTNLSGTASININGTVGATTPTTGVFTTLVAGNTTSLLLGTAGSAVGNIGFRNGTSGTATLAPPTGALGTYSVTLPNAASTLPIFSQQMTFTGPTAARTITYPDANFTVARTDAANTFTGHQTIEGVTSTGATGTGKFVFDGSPTLVTPNIGVATGTSVVLSGATAFTKSPNLGNTFSNAVVIGDPPDSGYPGIWFGTLSPTYSNYSFLFDGQTGTGGTILNAPTNFNILFRINNVTQFTVNGSRLAANLPFQLKSYTVSGLPAGALGDTACVTDATAPTYLGALTGGGSVKTPVFHNGSAWVSH